VFPFDARRCTVKVACKEPKRREFGNADAQRTHLDFAIESMLKVLHGLIANVRFHAFGHSVGDYQQDNYPNRNDCGDAYEPLLVFGGHVLLLGKAI
jgi:hypothetical protein